VLLVRGEYDGIATVSDLEAFFNKLPNGDRQFGHPARHGPFRRARHHRQLFWHAARSFLTMPSPIAS
jgi:hypothetical protein